MLLASMSLPIPVMCHGTSCLSGILLVPCLCSECSKIFVPVDMDEGTLIDQLPASYMPQFDWKPIVMLFIVAQNLFFMKATQRIFCQILVSLFDLCMRGVIASYWHCNLQDPITWMCMLIWVERLVQWVCGELSFWGAVESVTLIPQWDMMQLITIIWVGSLMIKSKQGAVRFEKYMTQFQS